MSRSQRWPFSQPAQWCPLARSLHDVVLEERLESMADLEGEEGLRSTEVELSTPALASNRQPPFSCSHPSATFAVNTISNMYTPFQESIIFLPILSG